MPLPACVQPKPVEDKKVTAQLLSCLHSEGFDVGGAVVDEFDLILAKGKAAANANPAYVDIDGEVLDANDPNAVPLETNVAEVCGSSNARQEKRSYGVYEWKLEAKYFVRDELPFSAIRHVRTAADLDRHLASLITAINNSSTMLFPCGVDTEGKGATAQFSIRVDGYNGKANLVVQLQSLRGNVLKDGVPPKLVEFFLHPKIVFIGKEVADDVRVIAQLLLVPAESCRQLRYVELDQVYNFAFNYAQSGKRLFQWIKTMPTRFEGPLGKPGLKSIHNFAKPTHILPK